MKFVYIEIHFKTIQYAVEKNLLEFSFRTVTKRIKIILILEILIRDCG